MIDSKPDLFSEGNVNDKESTGVKTDLMFCGKMPSSSDVPDNLSTQVI
jgi:hypothetical protein